MTTPECLEKVNTRYKKARISTELIINSPAEYLLNCCIFQRVEPSLALIFGSVVPAL